MMPELEGRIAVVTGATAGVGFGIADILLKRGAKVAVVSRRQNIVSDVTSSFCQIYGEGRAFGVTADVATAEGTSKVVNATMDHWGKIDLLVNNAGRPAHRPFLENDDDEWHADFDLKVMAAVRLSRLVYPHMKLAGGGRIVNILSMGAKVFPENSTPTTVSRAGGLALVKVLSKEFAKGNVLVNAVLLGFVRSEQWVRRWEADGHPGTLEDFYTKMGAAVPLGRIAVPSDVGEVVSFLASDRASYITGAAINVDGGLMPVA